MQRNWIGKSIGAEIHFPMENSKEVIKVFTTRQDTVFGATFMSLAPEHPLALSLSKGTAQEQAVREFVERMRRQDKMKRTAEDDRKRGCFHGSLLPESDDQGQNTHFRGQFCFDGVWNRGRNGCAYP